MLVIHHWVGLLNHRMILPSSARHQDWDVKPRRGRQDLAKPSPSSVRLYIPILDAWCIYPHKLQQVFYHYFSSALSLLLFKGFKPMSHLTASVIITCSGKHPRFFLARKASQRRAKINME